MSSYKRSPLSVKTFDPTPYKRIRVDNSIKSIPNEQRKIYFDCANLSWMSAGFNKPIVDGTFRSMVDYVVPRFKSRHAAGERFFNNMSSEEVVVSTSGNGRNVTGVAESCYATHTHCVWRDNREIILNFIPLSPADAKGNRIPVISQALSDAEIFRIQKLVSTEVWSKRGTADSDLWESAAQYRQTIDMLQNPLGRLKDLTKRLLQGSEKDLLGRSLMKEVSAGYLMNRYGIMPLVNDIKNVLSSLSKTHGKKEVTTRAKEQFTAHSMISGAYNDGTGKGNWINLIDDTVTIRGMSLDEAYISMANNLGLSMKGLAMLPLELTSYSFVADWFVNLSSYVQATLPVFGWNYKGSNLMTTRVTANSYTMSGDVSANPAVYTINTPASGQCGIIRVTKTRGPLLPASFEFKSDFKFDKFTRVADAVALIAGRFVKLRGLMGFSPNNSAFHDRKAYHVWEEYLHSTRH